jgi:PAS domain S-box-containing protein
VTTASEIELLREQIATSNDLLAVHEEQTIAQFELIRSQRRDLEDRTRALDRMNQELRNQASAIAELLAKEQAAGVVIQRLLNSVSQGLVTLDPSSALMTGRSTVFDRWFGAPADGTSFAACLRQLNPESAERFARGWSQLEANVLPLDLAIDRLPEYVRSGERHFRIRYTPGLDLAGKLANMFVVISDVTAEVERERSETRLRDLLSQTAERTEVSFRALIEQCPDAVIVHRDGSIVYANPAAVITFGFDSAAALVGTPLDVIGDPKAIMLLGCGNSGPASSVREVDARRRDGSAVKLEVSSLAVDFGGEPATLAIARDCTERKRLEGQLLQAERMASMGTLAAGMAHEINNPLAYIKANVAMIGEQLEGRGASAELLAMISDAMEGATRVQNIVAGMKVFSRANTEQRGPVDVHAALDLALRMTGNEIRHRCHVDKQYGAVPTVIADQGRLGQVFINLLINAAQAIPVGHVEHNWIRIITRTDDRGRAVVEVHDTGCGIPDNVRSRIFEPFFTTKDVGEGTGLGLSICHGIITAFGGEIDVTSQVGVGTTLRVLLPAAMELVSPPPAATMPSAAPVRGTVLVVDDDDRLRETLGRLLRKEYDVTVAARAEDALAPIRDGKRYTVIVSDLMMPEMTGMEFYAQLQGLDPQQAQRVVFITGGAFTSTANTFLATVANPRLDKPFELTALRNLVRRHSEFALEQDDSRNHRELALGPDDATAAVGA